MSEDPPNPLDSAITLDQLAAFRAVAEAGSFSAAGRRLGRAQSAISYQVANLESLLGLQLFDRSHRRPLLTDAGRAVLAEAQSVSSKVARLLSRAKEIAGGLESEVSLVVDVMFPLPRLLSALEQFRSHFPRLPIRLHTEALGGVMQLVLDGSCHVGIGPVFGNPSAELEHRALVEVQMVTVVAPDHPLAQLEPPVSRDALDEFPQLVLTDRSPFTTGLAFGVSGGPSWKLADLTTKHSLLLAALGWGNMPRHMVAKDLERGTLKELDLTGVLQPLLHRQSLIYRRAAPPGPAARWLLDKLDWNVSGASVAGV